MEQTHWHLIIVITIALSQNSSNVEGRAHFHKEHKGPSVYALSSQDPVSQSPAYSPVQSDTSEPGNSSSDCIFDVTSFGAIGDGSADDTAAFRAAWKAACDIESGVLLAPSNYTFMITSTIFSGPCKPGLVFQVDGVLMPPNGPDWWPKSDSNREWLVFYRLDQMTFTGTGTIEGNGEQWWELPCKPHRGPNGSTLPGPCDSPTVSKSAQHSVLAFTQSIIESFLSNNANGRQICIEWRGGNTELIHFFMSSDLVVSGLRVQNSPQFHMKFDSCTGVLIEKLFISSPKLSPNTDGIHIEGTKHVGIYNSVIGNGDDCISIGPGCSNVDIDGVTCGPSHGISIGSLGVHNSQACVSNITVRNTMIKDSDNGVRIKTWQGGTGSVSDISFENIEMNNVRNCIIIDQYYCLTKACRNQTSAVYLTDVSYRNIKGTYDVHSPPIHFACSDTVPCTNITMSEVELLPHEGELVDDPFCWNSYGIQETLTIPPIDCLQDGEPDSLAEVSTYGC